MLDKVATLQEVESYWSLDDVMRAADVLDAVAEARQPSKE